MIGDREHDARGAADNGIPFIAVMYGYGSSEEFDALQVTHRAQSPPELPPLIRVLQNIC